MTKRIITTSKQICKKLLTQTNFFAVCIINPVVNVCMFMKVFNLVILLINVCRKHYYLKKFKFSNFVRVNSFIANNF